MAREEGCTCRVSYQVPSVESGVASLYGQLADDLGTKFIPEGEIDTAGAITTSEGTARAHIINYAVEELSWLALVVQGPVSCPEDIAAEGT